MKHNNVRKWSCTGTYALLQAATWSFYAIIMAFSSNVLYEYGYSDSAISLIMGLSTALSVAVQVGSAELLSRKHTLGVDMVLILFGGILLLGGLALLLPGLGSGTAAILFGMLCMLLQTLPSLANSMGMDSIRRGAPTDYSIARGMGSLGYSASALLTGILVRRSGIRSVFVLTAVTSVLLMAAAFSYRRAVGEQGAGEEVHRQEREGSFFRKYPRFGLFLFGMSFLCISHALLCNFMYQIMVSRSGAAMEQGIATSISSLVELPIMFGFPFLLKKLRCDRWVLFAAFAMALKPVLMLLSGSPDGIYLAQATQSIGYGLWVIGSVNYAERVVDQGESIRAQSYHGAVTTVSTVAALSTGGVILDWLGVNMLLIVSLVCSCVGALIVALSIQKTE